ncbi:MAG: DNA polymerase III subunit gamma and tau [Actinobacteria bacterium]|nr:DNA polymerase III subunit gamma and tau [Actinomycetota bacterium]
MALYRTYRPARLDDVVGQDHVTGPLRRALENDRVHHAYLFSGPRGCGKTSTARILARSLNCEQGPTADPCGVCQSCTDLAPNGPGSLDVIELDAASHGGVDDTRDLRERAMYAPANSRYKVYIIDEAHMVTTAGFNALLKLVEEPPEHVRFIFATTEADKVLPTIRSRTHNYTFRLVPSKTLQSHLAYVCKAEGVPAEPAALALVARAGAGSVRDSLSVLGQVISGSGEGGVTYAEAVAQLGMTDAALLDESIDALADHDGAALFTVIDKVIDAGHDPRRFVTDLLERFRDLIVLHNVPNAAELGLIDAPEDQVSREIAQSQRFGPAELTRAADVTSAALSELRGATAPRLHLELMAARLLLPASDADEAGNRARLDQLERRLAAAPIHAAPAAPVERGADPVIAPTPPKRLSEVAPSTAAVPAEPAVPAPVVSAPPEPSVPAPAAAPRSKPPVRPRTGAQAPSEAPAAAPVVAVASPTAAASEYAAGLDQFVSMWPAVLEAVKSYSKVAWMAFSESTPISLSDGVLAVAVADAGKANNLKSSGHDERLRQAIIDVMKVDVKIDVVLAPNRVQPAATSPGEAAAAPVTSSEPDAPSMDDADSDGAVGVDLALRELGATRIGEIEH